MQENQKRDGVSEEVTQTECLGKPMLQTRLETGQYSTALGSGHSETAAKWLSHPKPTPALLGLVNKSRLRLVVPRFLLVSLLPSPKVIHKIKKEMTVSPKVIYNIKKEMKVAGY